MPQMWMSGGGEFSSIWYQSKSVNKEGKKSEKKKNETKQNKKKQTNKQKKTL